MVLTTTKYGNWTTLKGTLAEVAGGLNSNNVKKEQVIAFGVDVAGTAYFAVFGKN